MELLEFFSDIILPVARSHCGPGLDSASDKWIPGISPGGLRRPVRRADNLTAFYRLSWNLGASNSWNPQGLSKPVMGLLYELCFTHTRLNISNTPRTEESKLKIGTLADHWWPRSLTDSLRIIVWLTRRKCDDTHTLYLHPYVRPALR